MTLIALPASLVTHFGDGDSVLLEAAKKNTVEQFQTLFFGRPFEGRKHRTSSTPER